MSRWVLATDAAVCRRESFGIDYAPQETVNIPTRLDQRRERGRGRGSSAGANAADGSTTPVAVPGLHQTTVIVKFRPRSLANASGDPSDHRAQCPELYIDPDTKLERPPWYPGFVYRELGMVFKRFFFSYCELQILFSHLEGERLLRQGNGSLTDRIPWQWVLKAANLVLARPFSSIAELQAAVQRNARGELDAVLFAVRIRRASDAIVSVFPDREPAWPAVLLVGDAVVSAHYRLGVGVNKAFTWAVSSAYRELLDSRNVTRYRQQVSRHLDSVVQYQVCTLSISWSRF